MNEVESNSGEHMHQCTQTCQRACHQHAHVYYTWVELYNMCFFFQSWLRDFIKLFSGFICDLVGIMFSSLL